MCYFYITVECEILRTNPQIQYQGLMLATDWLYVSRKQAQFCKGTFYLNTLTHFKHYCIQDLTQEHTDSYKGEQHLHTLKYSTQSHIPTLFSLVSFQFEHFGERCFGTRVDQIRFSIRAEKLPVTAPNRWEPMNRNKAFISLPPKKQTEKRNGIRGVCIGLTMALDLKFDLGLFFVLSKYSHQKCWYAFTSVSHRKKINLHYNSIGVCSWHVFSTKSDCSQCRWITWQRERCWQVEYL